MPKTPATTAQMQVFEPDEGSESSAGLVPLYAGGGTQLPGVFLLKGGDTVIGRDATEVDLCLDRQAISRKHVQISGRRGRWKVTDLGSRNGTLVDGQLITEAQLETGCEIRVGDVIFKFVESDAETYVGYRFDGTMVPGTARQARNATMLLGGAQMDRLVAALERISPTMLSVILRGESGTGKEVAAREIHRLSDRKGAFVAVNCAAIPAPLLESELFGYRKGAFTGADRDRTGLIRSAHGGTLFLDEIGDMPLEAQAKLLRVLQSREVLPLGATTTEPVDVRIVCATHRDLRASISQNTFRGDLYARLQEYSVTLLPLRERKEDLYLLTKAFLARNGRTDVTISLSFMLGLLHYDWPYNVRELEACIKRALALATDPVLDTPHLPEAIHEAMAGYGRKAQAAPSREHARPPTPAHGQAPPSQPTGQLVPPLPAAGPAPDKGAPAPTADELRALLIAHQGVVTAVARVLGKERMQIHRWMKRYGLDAADFRVPPSAPPAGSWTPGSSGTLK
ncbi:MAG: sigma 54-interacting transcriptional regulator [Polyangiaceae bacterium]